MIFFAFIKLLMTPSCYCNLFDYILFDDNDGKNIIYIIYKNKIMKHRKRKYFIHFLLLFKPTYPQVESIDFM